jgi:hypothetical protein
MGNLSHPVVRMISRREIPKGVGADGVRAPVGTTGVGGRRGRVMARHMPIVSSAGMLRHWFEMAQGVRQRVHARQRRTPHADRDRADTIHKSTDNDTTSVRRNGWSCVVSMGLAGGAVGAVCFTCEA